MVAAFDYCLHRQGRCGPVDRHGHARARRRRPRRPPAPRLRHRRSRPSADGEALTKQIFGDRVVWVPWRRPGFQLGLDIAEIKRANPQAIGCILGGHGITAWGGHVGGVRGQLARDHPHRRGLHRRARQGRARSARVVAGNEPLPEAERRAKAAALAPVIRGLASTDRPMVGHFTDADVVLDFLASREASATGRAGHVAAPTTSCAPRSSRWCSTCPATASVRGDGRAARGAARGTTATDYAGLLRAQRRPGQRRRCAAPTRLIVLVPGRRHVLLRQGQADRPGRRRVLRQRHQRDARRRGALDLRPDRRVGEVPDRVLGARGGQARSGCRSPSRWRRGSRWSPARPPASARRSPPGSRPRAPASSSPTCRWRRRRRPRRRSAAPTSPSACRSTSPTRTPCRRWSTRPCSPSAASTSSSTTPGCRCPSRCSRPPSADWDLQHDVMAKGSFLVSRAAARVLIEQGLGGDIVYISSKNSVFAGPNNIAYSRDQGRPGPPGAAARRRARRARHQGQRHQPRRRRARLRHLRRRLGRQARRGLRRARGGARRVLRPAHPAQARGAARARRQRRLRPASDPTSPTPPGCTSRSTPASPRRSCDEPAMPSASPPSTSGPPAAG